MSIKNIVFSILAVAACSSFAMAQGGGQPMPKEGMGRGDGPRGGMMMRREGGERRMGRGGMMNFERLNLTDAQKQRIQTLLENNRKTMESGKAQFEEMGNLMRLKAQGLLTTEQGTRLTSLQAQMKTTHERMQNDILSVLTPEQKTLFEQSRGGERGGMGRGEMRMRRGGGEGGRRGPNGPNAPMGAPQAPKPNN
jgi:Spy/CpxP family protein refolding chaperone